DTLGPQATDLIRPQTRPSSPSTDCSIMVLRDRLPELAPSAHLHRCGQWSTCQNPHRRRRRRK
ncbi:hypothetical protein BGZ70_006723, partial [Mortierella alpina]